jgi:hypothetical protein
MIIRPPIAFEGVAITSVQDHMGKPRYDGTVTFQIQTDSLEFKYIYQFHGAADVQAAIGLGAQSLKRELDHLSAATGEIQYSP